MKTMNSIVWTLILISLVMTSCDRRIRKNGSGVVTTTTRSLTEFNGLDIDGEFDVFLHQSDEPYLTISTDDNIVSLVQTFVQDGELNIEMSDDFINYDFTRMEVHIYGQGYADVDLDGAINLTCVDTIQNQTSELSMDGSGNVRFYFSGNSLIASINGSGRLEAAGDCNSLSYEIKGSGKIDGLDLVANNVSAEINGSGDIYVHALNTLHAEIDGSGDVRYLGNPLITSEIRGSGSVAAY